MIKSRKQMFVVIGAFALVLMLGTVTYAFFNYTRTGAANTIRVGRISFVSEQTQQNTINLTNAFPISRSSAGTDTTNTDDVVVNITGDTTYSDGIEYLLTATAVENTKNNKTVPISIVTTASNLGTSDEEYFDNRGGSTAVYKVLAKNTISNNDQLLVGYIPSGVSGVNGSVTIRAFLDRDLVSISDTYDETNGVSNNMGTTSTWVNGRTNFTTTEWNDINVSFKVKVEAREGLWVEEIKTVNAMGHLFEILCESGTYNRRDDIKKIVFQKMGATRMQNAYDAATVKLDVTANNEGKVLAWLEENEDDSTMYTLVVASDGDTYFTYNMGGLFNDVSSVEEIEFNNVNTSRITYMSRMFYNCTKLKSIDISSFNMENVTDMSGMFGNCADLASVNVEGINTSSVVNMNAMFRGCTSLTSIDISGWGGPNLQSASGMFDDCTNLEMINMHSFNFGIISGTLNFLFSHSSSLPNLRYLNMSKVNFGSITNLTAMIYEKTNLIDVDLSDVDTTGTTNMTVMFYGNTNLKRIYVSDNWNVNNVTSSSSMFANCPSLVGQAPNTTYAFTDYNVADKTYAVIATNDTVGYLTDISLKPTA